MRKLIQMGVIAGALAMTMFSPGITSAAQAETSRAGGEWRFHRYNVEWLCNVELEAVRAAGYQTDPPAPYTCFYGASEWLFWHFEPGA
ncbi:hypothetical protein DP939_39390 [Spongiactinospora rosea]|uniref:Secreted protein n=1 Tax=Spongiactinospora rosea TaxID=2248750 RepID=A0A366LMY7_9ACTN|nr:hypothetical protein [Spongiactinospora rosea]RBQ14674.1 hypothetical protein DP939_39390 [Spongiactinospora rosea]